MALTQIGSDGLKDQAVTDPKIKDNLDYTSALEANTISASQITSTGAALGGGTTNAAILDDDGVSISATSSGPCELRFLGTSVGDYVAFKSDGSFSGTTTFVLPDGDGSANQVLKTDGSGNLDWTTTTDTNTQLSNAEVRTAVEAASDSNVFTDADHTKLDGIAAGAEVNVQSDWNSSSGDNQILNKPTIPAAVGGAAGVDFNDDIKIRSGTGNDLEIYHSSDHSHVYNSNTTGKLRLRSDSDVWIEHGTENMIVAEGDGAVKIYHDGLQRLYTATWGSVVQSEGDTTLRIEGGTGNGSGYAQLHLDSGTSVSNYIQSDTGIIIWVNGANRAKFETDGTFIVQDGNVKIGTAGHGIDFSATSDAGGMTSELLDDYEEGTYTPQIWASGSSSNLSITYTGQVGHYTKVGNVVQWSAEINYSAKSGAESNSTAYLTVNLPFTTKTNSWGNDSIAYNTAIEFDNGSSNVHHNGNNTFTYFWSALDAGRQDYYPRTTNLHSSGSLKMSGTYLVN